MRASGRDDPARRRAVEHHGRRARSDRSPCARACASSPARRRRSPSPPSSPTTRERAFELADRYDDPHAAQRALDLAWTTAQVELRELNITPADAAVFQDVAGHLFYAERSLGPSRRTGCANRGSQPLLWSIGISGDWPILLASIDSVDGLPTLRQLLAAHRYWRRRGMLVDLVVLDTHPPSYNQQSNDRIMAAVLDSGEAGVRDQPGGIFVRRADIVPPDVLLMLRATARVHVACEGQSLGRTLEPVTDSEDELESGSGATLRLSERSTPQVVRRSAHHVDAARSGAVARRRWQRRQAGQRPGRRSAVEDDAPDALARHVVALLGNGIGGLTADGDYEIRLVGADLPPAPWVERRREPARRLRRLGARRGLHVGGEQLLLPPHALAQRSGERSGERRALPPRRGERRAVERDTGADPPRERRTPCGTRGHARRSSTSTRGIATELTLGIAPDDPVKLSLLRITNRDARPRRLTVTAYVEWTLGVQREHTRHHVQTSFDARAPARSSRGNTFEPTFAERVAFCAMSEPVTAHTATGASSSAATARPPAPAALRPREPLVGRAPGAGLDPCAALQCAIELAPGESRELAVALGAGETTSDAQRLAETYGDAGRARAARRADGGRRGGSGSSRHPRPHAGAVVRRDDQSLVALPGARLPDVGALGALSVERRVRLPRPAAGRDGVRVRGARGGARAHPPRGGAAVRRGRRAALVASAQRARRAHASSPTTWRGCRSSSTTTCASPATRRCSTSCVPFITMRAARPDEHEAVRPAAGDASERATRVRALPARAAPRVHHRHARPAADRHRRLERRDEPRRRPGHGESVWLAWFLVDDAPPVRRARRRRAATRRRRPGCARSADGYAAAVERDGMGRRLVPPRVLRRRHAARLARRTTSAGSTRSRRAGASSRARAIAERRAPGDALVRASISCARTRG